MHNTHKSLKFIDIGGVASCLAYGTLAISSHYSHSHKLFLVLTMISIGWMSALLVCWRLKSSNGKLPLKRILMWALLFRIIGLAALPMLDDDYHRYLWDGYHFAQTGTPYGTAPEKYFIDPNITQKYHDILSQINNPDIPTIYGPTSQYLFLIAHYLQPGRIFSLKFLLVLADCATILLLLKLVPDKRFLMLYAWCPLLIFEVAFNAHVDILGVFLLVSAIFCLHKQWNYKSALTLALAIGAKLLAIVIAPLLLVKMKKAAWIIFAGILAILYLPFLLHGKTDLIGVYTFITHWEFNSFGFALLKSLSNFTVAKYLAYGIFTIFLAWYAWYCRQQTKTTVVRGDIIFGIFFLLTPVLNPWYLLWLLPFAAIYPTRWSWTALIVISLAYLTGLNLPQLNLPAYNHPAWLRPLEFTPIIIAALLDFYYHRKSLRNYRHP